MARNFDDADEENLNAGDVLNNTTDTITLSAWVKFDVMQDQKLFGKWSSGGQSYLLQQNASDLILFALNIDVIGVQIATGTTTMVTGVWYHIVGTYDGTTMRVYLNGVEEGTLATTGNIQTSTTPLRIGSGSPESNGPLDGDMGHCAIWDTDLTADEIATLAQGVSPLKIRRDGNLLFYAPINGQSPEPDIVGGFDLTLEGTPTVSEEPPIPYSIVAGGN